MSRARTNADQAHTESFQSAHIIPDVLYPSSGNDLAGDALVATTTGPNSSTVASSKYGTVQASDGRMYYYTDIKGSKPIKDPRIGSHFGSQRHPFTALQLLEQETATHGENVYSIDGREWARGVQTINSSYDAGGTNISISSNTTSYIEVVGYFNNISVKVLAGDGIGFRFTLNGGTEDTTDRGATTSGNPFYGRYVDSTNVVNVPINASLGINTVKLRRSVATEGLNFGGIELIAQDTSNVNNIQIPSQNVVSYGKKFTVAGTPHYNPFAFAGDGTTAVAIGDTTSHGKVATGWAGSTSAYFDSTLDTATSLGLSAWETDGDFYRPINGGRVVRWVDSSGNIKTSVNMMPPCATAITAGSDASLPTSHAWTTVYQPKIKSGSIDHSQAEVAKTFHVREFGNGSANGNASYADPSTVVTDGSDDLAYVMDDGLTSFSGASGTVNSLGGHGTAAGSGIYTANNTTSMYVTFMGTGLSGGIDNTSDATRSGTITNVAQNLPYGTHILKLTRGTYPASTIDIDGVQVYSGSTPYTQIRELTFHQPKMPPIPEDAVVIADYMLMADHVALTSADLSKISKGVRFVSCTRDHFYDESTNAAFALDHAYVSSFGGMRVRNTTGISSGEMQVKLPYFGTDAIWRGEDAAGRISSITEYINSTTLGTRTAVTSSEEAEAATHANSPILGLNGFRQMSDTGEAFWYCGVEIASPIHTSSHYKSFETPFLHELVGGDRNMEQTNLVVTPDGKTWDEVTRDVSYIGNIGLSIDSSVTMSDYNGVITWDKCRGVADATAGDAMFNKDFALAYDSQICLRDGQYHFEIGCRSTGVAGGSHLILAINGTICKVDFPGATNSEVYRMHYTTTLELKRGDKIRLGGRRWADPDYSQYTITRV